LTTIIEDSGIYFLEFVKKVLVSSGYSNDPIMANFADYGFAGVISKLYQMRELSETIQTVLSG
jgi:DNA-binding NarL/FixJ family response regulator